MQLNMSSNSSTFYAYNERNVVLMPLLLTDLSSYLIYKAIVTHASSCSSAGWKSYHAKGPI